MESVQHAAGGRTRTASDPKPDCGKQRRAAQQDKFAWLKAVLADEGLSNGAKVIASTISVNYLGSKGYAKAELRTLMAASGNSRSTVVRGIDDLKKQHYWDVDCTAGRASTYTLVKLDERIRRWLAAESEWKRTVTRWCNAESDWRRRVTRWLHAEQQLREQAEETDRLFAERQAQIAFEAPLFNAAVARLGTHKAATDRAMRIAQLAWAAHQAGDGNAHADCMQCIAQLDPMPQPEPVQVEAEPPTAPADPIAECRLCDRNGMYIDAVGNPVQMLGSDDEAQSIACRHSEAANIDHIKQIDRDSDGYWWLKRTGWTYVDSQFPHLDTSPIQL